MMSLAIIVALDIWALSVPSAMRLIEGGAHGYERIMVQGKECMTVRPSMRI
jgi:hypothetical protein